MTDRPTTAGIVVTAITYDETKGTGRHALPLAFTIPWWGEVPVKGIHDAIVEKEVRRYGKWLTACPLLAFDWNVEPLS